MQPAPSVPIPVLPYPQYTGGVASVGPTPGYDYQSVGMHPAAALFGQPQHAAPGQQNLQPEFPQSVPATQISPNCVREKLHHYDAGDSAPPVTVPVHTEAVCCSRSGPLNAPAGEPRRRQPYYTGESGRRVSVPPTYHQAGIDSPSRRHRHSRHVEFSTDDSGGFAMELTHGCRSCGKGLRVSSAGMLEGEGTTDQGRGSCDQCVAERQAKAERLAEEERLKEDAKAREVSKEQIRREVRAELEKEDAERREMENTLRIQAEEKTRREELTRLAAEELEKRRIDEEVKIELERRRLEDLRIREEVRLREVEKERLRKQSEIEKERKRKEAELKALEAAKQLELEKEIDRRMRMEEENRIREEEKERRKSEARERLREDITREREESKKLEAARIKAQDARLKELEAQRLDAEKQEKLRLQAEAERILRDKIRKELEEEDRARLEAETILKAKEATEEQERLRVAEDALHEQRLKEEVERLHLEKDMRHREYIRAQQCALDRAKIKQQLIEEAAAAKFAEQAQRERISDEIIASGWQAGQLIDESELMRRLGGSYELTHLAAAPPVIPAVPPIAPIFNAGLGHFSNSPLRVAPDSNNPSVPVAPPPPPPHREKVNLHWETSCPQQGHQC